MKRSWGRTLGLMAVCFMFSSAVTVAARAADTAAGAEPALSTRSGALPAAASGDPQPAAAGGGPDTASFVSHPYSFTQNTDAATITSGNSVSCNAFPLHAENSYFRRFDLDGDHGLQKRFSIASVDIGIESASGSGGSQPVEVWLYEIANDAPLNLTNIRPLGMASFSQADASLTIQNYPVSGIIDPNINDLVVELYTPDGQTDGNSLFIGSNALGQSGPSFIFAPACGVSDITDLATLGFPTVHIVMVVHTGTAKFPWPMYTPATGGAAGRALQR